MPGTHRTLVGLAMLLALCTSTRANTRFGFGTIVAVDAGHPLREELVGARLLTIEGVDVDTLLEWSGSIDGERPYFMYMHVNDAHMPYKDQAPWYEPREGELADQIARYDSEISYLDQALRRVHDELRWDEDAIVIVISRHEKTTSRTGTIVTASMLRDPQPSGAVDLKVR